MSGQAKSAQDKAMAARLKAEGVKRNTARCPICNKMVNIKGMYTHIVTCK